MATNEILPFAQGVGANVQSQVDYAAEALRTSGNVAGIARSNVNNKALRQASVIAAGVAQFMADNQPNDVTDSLTPAAIATFMEQSVQALSATDYLNTTRINVASAATVNLTSSAPNTRHINITGTTTITAFTVAAGQCYFVRFDNALTLTNGAALVTQSGANITTAAGDTCIIRATAANVVEVLAYTPSGGWARSLAANGYQKLPSGLIIQWGTTTAASVTFPIAFPGGVLARQLVINDWSTTIAAAGQYTAVTAISNTGFTVDAAIGGSGNLRWLAIGY